ncbi:DUF6867 family protein [Methylobacterium sp. Leaf112]|uniref:DUF6867 family protein n=1 Tax=Methylobacterium sp. Leaf112 TaxID=1736258 RepID=UPI0006FAF9A4|nr:hypothetical protein [Methylobacterium sp. Leaf112]KQP65203.1 hypothetical protein ASF52_19940 [Methylobacterium sp. Leaf112]
MPETFALTGATLGIFLLVTVAMGGSAAWMTGSGMARGWRPFWHCALALLLIAAVTRFLHYALFEGTLLSAPDYAVDAVFALAVGAFAYRFTRAGQMTRQYAWLYERTGPLSWRDRPAAP